MTSRDYIGAVLTLTGALTGIAALALDSLTVGITAATLVTAGLITLNERQDS